MLTTFPSRRHTIIAGTIESVSQLQKDWFSYAWASGWPVRHVISRPQGEFHVVSNIMTFSRAAAEKLVDAAIAGKTHDIDLREYSVRRR
jgi:hypothetical protein